MGSKCALLTVVVFFVALTLSLEGSARELRDTFSNVKPPLPFDEETVSSTRELAETFNTGQPPSPLLNLWLHFSLSLSLSKCVYTHTYLYTLVCYVILYIRQGSINKSCLIPKKKKKSDKS